MKKILLSILISLFISVSAKADGYIAVDVPAMKNMAVGETIEIDGVDGSVIQISTSVGSTKSQVSTFYNKKMIDLGWKKVGNLTYMRDGETLKISFGAVDNDGISVDFTITSPFE